MKQKVALFITDLNRGGAERVTVYLANGLTQRGYDVDLLLIRKTGTYQSDLSDAVRIVELGARGAMFSIPKVVRYLRTARPSVLLATTDHISVAAIVAKWLARSHVPVITAIHQAYSRYFHADYKLKDRMVLAALKRILPRASAVVAVSRGAAADAIRTAGIPPHLVRVIYNPVIMPDLNESAQRPVDHPWFASGQPGVILAVGSLTTVKRFDWLIRAFAILHRNRAERLMILGEGEERKHLEDLIRELGLCESVALPGFVRNPFANMSKASLLALSSQFEALPTVIIESLAVGTPVVATDCPHGPAEILDGGRYGRLVPVGDVEALAQALEACLVEGRSVVPDAALRPYLLDYAVDQYCRLIAEVTSPGGLLCNP